MDMKLLPEFEYPVSCTDIKISQDSKYLVSCGIYKPSVRIHDLPMQSLVLERNIQNEPMEIVLIDSISRYGILTSGNKIELHNSTGMQKLVKIPFNCRSVVYASGELIVGGDRSTLLRYDLHKDRLGGVLDTGMEEVNSIKQLDNGMLGVCGSYKISMVDIRSSKTAISLGFDTCLSALEASGDACYVGDEDGYIHIIDLSTYDKVCKIDNGVPPGIIKCSKSFLVTSGNRSIKIWKNLVPVAEISIGCNINSVEIVEPLIFLGLESGEMKTFYIPDMGEPPEWCSFVRYPHGPKSTQCTGTE